MASNLKRNSPKKVSRFSDGPTKEFQQHHRVEVTQADNGLLHQRVVGKVVIEHLHTIGTLNDEQFYTGDRLFRDWYYSSFSGTPAHMRPEVRIRENPPIEKVLDATERYSKGLDLMPQAMQDVVTGVCIDNLTIIEVGKKTKCHKDAARARLQDGLDILTKWYAHVFRA